MSLEKFLFNIKKGVKSIAIPFLLSAFLYSCPLPASSPVSIHTTDGYDYTTTTKIVASKNINTSGGSLEVTDSNSFLQGSKLTIPEGALDSDKFISIAEVNNPSALPNGLGYVGSAMDFEPDETNFSFPITIVIPYNDEFLSDAGISDDSNLGLYSYNKISDNWTEINTFSLDTVNNTITANINHFSYYAITCLNSDPPEDLGNPQPGDLLYTLGAFWYEGHPIFFNNWMPGHVGIYTGEKKYPGTGLASDDVKEFEVYNVIEALWEGVQYSYYDIPNAKETFESSLNSFNGGNLYMGAREPKDCTLTLEQRAEIVTYIESQIGKPYAWTQTIGSAFGMLPGPEVKGSEKFNCVGLAEKAYEQVGVNDGDGLVPEEHERGVITPAEQYNSTKPSIGIYSSGPVNAPIWCGSWINIQPENCVSQSFRLDSPYLSTVEVGITTGNPGSGGDTLTLKVISLENKILSKISNTVEEGYDGWLKFTIPDDPLYISSGNVIKIQLEDTGKIVFGWKYSDKNTYSNGTAFFYGSEWTNRDFFFRINY